MIICAVPAKDLVNAKQRLVPALGPRERHELARAMLSDVLAALRAARLDGVWVVTRDPEVIELAVAIGAEPLASLGEAANSSHTTAVAFAQAEAARRGARAFLTVPGDVPCLTGDEIQALVAGAREGAPAFAPSRSGFGTNSVALTPPDAVPLKFCEPSFQRRAAAARQSTPLAGGDLLVVGQKIVSKAEGRIVRLADVTPSSVALGMATGLGRDPRLVEVILRESRRIVRMDQGVLITETHHGWVCANAGVDQSNVDVECVALLPEDPDGSARALRDRIRALAGVDVFVIVADTFGRPWREGLTNVAIGLAGLSPLRSYLGERDPAGRPLQATILAVADELAAAAEPVMGKLDRIPAAIVRGAPLTPSEEGSKPLLRDPARDLFR